MDPSTWDGAAFTMGNSTKTWKTSYAPTLKNRAVQGVVDGYTNFTSRVNGASDDVMECQHVKPRIPTTIPPPITNILTSPLPERSPSQMIIPYMCLPQPEIGKVDAILVDGAKSGKKRKIGSRPICHNFRWGGEWEGW